MPNRDGYWAVDAAGEVYTIGDALTWAACPHVKLDAPIVGIYGTANGGRLYLVAADGGVHLR